MAEYVPVLKDYMSTRVLAAELRITPQTLGRMCAMGRGPRRTYLGNKILYHRETVKDWLETLEEKS